MSLLQWPVLQLNLGQAQTGGVATLIMSPSSELAMQIVAEAEQLLRFHDIRAEVRLRSVRAQHICVCCKHSERHCELTNAEQ